MIYRELEPGEARRELFANFSRRQVVTKCWRKIDGQWCIKDVPFIDDWSEADHDRKANDITTTLAAGGFVGGAFEVGVLKGLVIVNPVLFGKNGEYMDLSSIHVSEDMRGRGVGRKLFGMACDWAKEHGAKKLYISAHSAVESQAFYHAMGCVEAEEYNQAHVEEEPCDCQLERVL